MNPSSARAITVPPAALSQGATSQRLFVRVGTKVEALYREIRALRIYEGASEVQKMIIARELLRSQEPAERAAAEQSRRHVAEEPGCFG